jgi:thiamine biosynthesis lipoprotein
MTGPTAIPARFSLPQALFVIDRERPAMATTARVRLLGATLSAVAEAEADADAALEVFPEVERHCSRFDPASALSRANQSPGRWHRAPAVLLEAVEAAHRAYLATDGLFDPRVLGVLVALGYDRSLPFADGAVATPSRPAPLPAPGPWLPEVDHARGVLNLGGIGIDLGGIGKGLAVRWAAEALTGRATTALVEAGGDLLALGPGPDGEGWLVGVDDPRDTGGAPTAVLRLTDRACATSSTALRRWTADGRPAHHLIDPRTGTPADSSVASVTVVGEDPAEAEVWSKTLLLLGASAVDEAEARGIAAFVQHRDGRREVASALRPHLLWEAGDGR